MSDKPLSKKSLRKAVDVLCSEVPQFARIVNEHGYPPLWDREPGFQTLVHIILEQQVSLASAKACLDKLLAVLPSLTPRSFLELGDEDLRSCGFSRQKTRYCRVLAERSIEDTDQFESLGRVSDEDAYKFLVSLTGIGPWTAQVYQLMVLKRPDIWPSGDRALIVSARETFEMDRDPSDEELFHLAGEWKPWRSAGARILWQGYLGRRNRQES